MVHRVAQIGGVKMECVPHKFMENSISPKKVKIEEEPVVSEREEAMQKFLQSLEKKLDTKLMETWVNYAWSQFEIAHVKDELVPEKWWKEFRFDDSEIPEVFLEYFESMMKAHPNRKNFVTVFYKV
jgi:hypothetical protein